MRPVNEHVVNGFEPFEIDPVQSDYLPQYAATSCLSEARMALWTNRVPEHEPWPRGLKGNPDKEETDYTKNTNHVDQLDRFDREVGRVEGDETIQRGKFWRR